MDIAELEKMSEREAVNDVSKNLGMLLKFDHDRLYSREEWGSQLTLQKYRPDFERAFVLARIFSELPYELLPDQQLTPISNAINSTASKIEEINSFSSVSANNPQQTLEALGTAIGSHADALTVQMAPWISYLAYRKGDVAENISSLNQSIDTGRALVKEAEIFIKGKKDAISTIVQQAQDIAGDKGVAVFTKQFDTAAINAKVEADIWLKSTGVLFLLALVLIFIFMYQLVGVSEWWQWAPRAALVGVLISGAIWCGKTYRILRHQHTTNLHKANGLKSFLAFRDASDNDPTTRNAVLLETTRSIFSDPRTGFINEEGKRSEGDIRILDSARLAGTITRDGSPTPG